MDTASRPVTVVSHCYGYGGIDLGLQRVFGSSIVTIAACEIEAFAIRNCIAQSEKGILDGTFPIFSDIKSFPFGKFRGLVDIYTAGFPCQPFSCAGGRKGDDDPRHLFPYIKRGLVEMQPEWVFLENVEGILSATLKSDGWNDPKGTPVLLHVFRELERVGYDPEAGIFSASEVGATHQRKRVFIMARRRDPRGRSLPVLSEDEGRCWACPVWMREEQWEKLRKSVGLANPESGTAGQQETGNRGQGIIGRSEKDLANSENDDAGQQQQEGCIESEDIALREGRWREFRDESVGCGEDMGRGSWQEGSVEHPKHDGLSADEVSGGSGTSSDGHEKGQNATSDVERTSGPCGLRDLWPERPGNPQFLWEPPRVVGDCKKGSVDDASGGRHGQQEEKVRTRGNSAVVSGTAMENSDCGSDGDGKTHGSGDGQGRQHASSGTSGVQQERQVDGDRSKSSGGHSVCAKCGFCNIGKWKRKSCLVCGQKLDDSDIVGRQNELVGTGTMGEGGAGRKGCPGNRAEAEDTGSHGNEKLDDSKREFGPERGGQRQKHRDTGETTVPAPSSEESGRESGEGKSEIESEVGGVCDGGALGMVLSDITGLNHEELEEIRHWMRDSENRVDELRMLGNGVVPATAAKAFRTLYGILSHELSS